MRSLYPDSYTRLMGNLENTKNQNAVPTLTCGLCNPYKYPKERRFALLC